MKSRWLLVSVLALLSFFYYGSANLKAQTQDTVFVFGFEQGADQNGLPIGTAGPWDWNDNGSVATIDSTNPHSGKYCGTIYNPDAKNLITCAMDVITENVLKPKAKYHLSIWVKTNVSQGEAQIIQVWDNNRVIHVSGNTDWTKYEFDFTAPDANANIRLHMQDAKGQAWYDDLVIVETAPPPSRDTVANPSFELPNDEGNAPADWWVTDWGCGDTRIGPPGQDSLRYVWDNTVAHSGNYSVMMQQTPCDTAAGWLEAAWGTDYLNFKSGGLYEMSYWVKIEDMPSHGYGITLNIGYNGQDLRWITHNTDWVQIKDTILFPTDQDDNYWRNQMRFRLYGYPINKDTVVKVWIDDVHFTYLGTQVPVLDSLNVVKEGNNVVLSWPSANVSSPIYHVLMQPYNPDGNYANNVLENPGFEQPNADGSLPEAWYQYIDTWAGQAATPLLEYPADDKYAGNFGVFVGELDPSDPHGIYARWEQTYDVHKLRMEQAYLYGAMVKYQDVVCLGDSIVDPEHPNGYYWDHGVNLYYDRFVFEFQNHDLVKLGWSTPVGSSDGWTQIFMPLPWGQIAPRHHFGIGLGQYWGGMAKGSLWIDNAFVVPFDEVGTTTDNTFTVENVPENVKYFAVYVEDASGEYLKSSARIGVIKAPNAIREKTDQPLKFALEQNYPNPFNPTTKIKFTIPQNGIVKLAVYDILGRKVADLLNRKMKAGKYTVNFNAANLASGVYFYRLQAGNHISTKKMMLLK